MKVTEKMYYVRNEGYLGNALIWWQKGRNGYTCDINNAHKFTLEEAERVCERPQDSAYECDYIDSLEIAKKTIIDCQYVDEANRLFKRKEKRIMGDITLCTNKSCTIRERCYRATARPNELNQYYQCFEQTRWKGSLVCDFFIKNGRE